LIVTDVTRVGNDECWVEARPAKRGGLSIKYRLDYGSDNVIGKQTIELRVTPATFRSELAAARTFLLQNEAEWLRSRGLGSRVTPHDVLVFGDLGPIENTLRFEDECVRHKALDLVGDLALANCEIVGQIIAYRSGHRLNAELARALLAEGQRIEPRRKSA
jgi:UDP-3-O-acyl-N-acetylglucosamine deacetylase